MFKVKIIVIGPCESGKTAICNILADATERSSEKYCPTHGVRILEFESEPVTVKGQQKRAAIELWDCSGDEKYEDCWPAIAKDTHGVLFVYNPSQKNMEKQLDVWYKRFVLPQGLKDTQCAVFQCRTGGHVTVSHSSVLSKFFWASSSIDDDGGESTKRDFREFLERMLKAVSERRDQEELSIISHD